MTTYTETVDAWLPQHCRLTPEQLASPVAGTAAMLGYTRDSSDGSRTVDMSEHGWTKVGTAVITLQLIDRDALVLNKIEALKAEAKKTRADAAVRCNEIETQIQNLLAITHSPSAELARTAGDEEVDEDDDVVDADFDPTCPDCDGTGEGSHDGASCHACKGKGIQ